MRLTKAATLFGPSQRRAMLRPAQLDEQLDRASSQTAAATTNKSASDMDWLLPFAAVTTVEVALWLLAWRAGVTASPLFARFSAMGDLILAVAGLTAFLFQLSRMALSREANPLRRCADMLRRNAPRIIVIIVAVQLSVLGGAAVMALKTALPSVVPFWADAYVAALELRLFGSQPFALSQRLLGWATPAIDFVYASWLLVQIVAFYALLLLKPSPLKTRALISHSFSWLILGIGGAYLLSSVGPIFYDRIYGGQAFAGLLATLHHAPVATRTSEMLWSAYFLHTHEVASGISAMPSMHVAMAFWLAMVVRTAARRFGWLAWSYFGLICLGSVHLGWHYVSDGVLGVAGAALMWRVAGAWRRKVAWNGSPAPTAELVTAGPAGPGQGTLSPTGSFTISK